MEVKNSMKEIKNITESFHSRLDHAEERISEHNRYFEIITSDKKIINNKNNEEILFDKWGTIKWPNI